MLLVAEDLDRDLTAAITSARKVRSMRRSDGRLIKTIKPFNKLIPYIMTRRSDAQVFAKQIVTTDKIDAYLHEKRDQDIKISYMHLFITIYMRVIAERPQLNRFVMNNKLYARDEICISMAVKRALHDDAEETTVKFVFTGRENIFEVVKIINQTIDELSNAQSQNEMDGIISGIMSMPGAAKKMMVGLLKYMDRHNFLPRMILDISPFHTSLFFSYLKSIKTNYVYHHLYDFGNTGIFVALGRAHQMPMVENDAVVVKKCCEIGYTVDERICDGLYLANSFKLAKKYLDDPCLLETGLEAKVEDIE